MIERFSSQVAFVRPATADLQPATCNLQPGKSHPLTLTVACVLAALFLACGERTAPAATLTLQPAADTTLIETEPDNNLGSAPFFNAGVTQNFTKNHALLRFDPARQIPAGSQITRADLILEVTHIPRDGFAPADFGLHRLLVSWGEGNKTAEDPSHPGLGAPATVGEATWEDRFARTTNHWIAPGAAPTNDYCTAISSQQTIYDIGNSPYVFESTPALVADVQSWLDDPQTNFGWLLKTLSEEENFTARRFASREDTSRAPLLVIEFVPSLRIVQPEASGGQFHFHFATQAGQAYQVEYRNAFSNNGWLPLTNIPSAALSGEALVVDSLSEAHRFYRIVAP